MKMFFKTRKDARNFNKKSVNAVKVVDTKNTNKRWAVEIKRK